MLAHNAFDDQRKRGSLKNESALENTNILGMTLFLCSMSIVLVLLDWKDMA